MGCDRILFLFRSLCIAAMGLFVIASFQHSTLSLNTFSNNEFVWMLIIGFITIFIMELFIHCIGLSTPNRLKSETIELLVESESKRIQELKLKKSQAKKPQKSKEKYL